MSLFERFMSFAVPCWRSCMIDTYNRANDKTYLSGWSIRNE